MLVATKKGICPGSEYHKNMIERVAVLGRSDQLAWMHAVTSESAALDPLLAKESQKRSADPAAVKRLTECQAERATQQTRKRIDERRLERSSTAIGRAPQPSKPFED